MKTYHQFIKINEAIAGNVCPVATLEPSVNSANKANAVQNYLYGPVNTQDKKMVEIYWTELANELNMSPDVVETARCSSCVYNNRSTEVSDCIIQGMGGTEALNPLASVEKGFLGYCQQLHFITQQYKGCKNWEEGGQIEDGVQK